MSESSVAPAPTTNVMASAPSVINASRLERPLDPPIQDTLVDLWENLSKLVQQEIALAKTEISQKAQLLKAEVLSSLAGAVLLFAGLLGLVAGIILLLAHVMPAWVAASLTGAVVGGCGVLLLTKRRPSVADLTPDRTLQNLKKDVQTFTEARR